MNNLIFHNNLFCTTMEIVGLKKIGIKIQKVCFDKSYIKPFENELTVTHFEDNDYPGSR